MCNILKQDFNSNFFVPPLQALGSLYFIHNSLQDVQIFDFHSKYEYFLHA